MRDFDAKGNLSGWWKISASLKNLKKPEEFREMPGELNGLSNSMRRTTIREI
ncbi:hypothetical protein [Geoglobus sp.]